MIIDEGISTIADIEQAYEEESSIEDIAEVLYTDECVEDDYFKMKNKECGRYNCKDCWIKCLTEKFENKPLPYKPLEISKEEIIINKKESDKMNKALEIELYVYKNLVFGSILKQDDNIIKRNNFEFTASNKFEIKSYNYPYCCNDAFYIQGVFTEGDNDVFVKKSKSNEEAQEYANKIKVAVDELNEKYSVEKVEDKVLSDIIKIL